MLPVQSGEDGQQETISSDSGQRFSAPQLTLQGERSTNSVLFQGVETLQSEIKANWNQHQDPSVWLDEELTRFFNEKLSPAMQQRETQLINDMYECFERELRERTSTIHDQLKTREFEITQVRTQLDRRIADSNAMRKEYYKHLLMLRDMVNKQKNDPRTLSALNDAITNASSNCAATDTGLAGVTRSPRRLEIEVGRTDGLMSPTARRDKEKWEQRLHEASSESQQLRDQISMLRNQIETLSQSESSLWFTDANNGIGERQRIIDAVYKGKCTWEDVGASVVELLNNDVIWERVERSVRFKPARGSRGLEGLITKLDALQSVSSTRSSTVEDEAFEVVDLVNGRPAHRLSTDGGNRLIPCRACNGAGYISSSGGGDDDDSDSYLRRTLAQVLELKAALENATTRSKQLERELHTTLTCYSQLQNRMEQIEADKLHRAEIGIQADLDEEDDEMMVRNALNLEGDHDINWEGSGSRRKMKRVEQYERLISELKRSLADKDTGIRDLRGAVESSQARLVALQRQSQQEQESFKREISSLKTSLTLAMKHRDSNLDEKQAAVKILIKRLTSEQRQMTMRRHSTATLIKEESDSDTEDGDKDLLEGNDDLADCSDDEHELERSEKIARRYSEAIDRVQKEFEDHQTRMMEIEEEIKHQEDSRKRTNSIVLGNIVVSMSSHPRDLFKALSTAQSELSKLRRASQKSSTLQADRLLTLTTHLSHISEELCMVRKRTNAEIEYWRLECEKLQNTNYTLLIEQQGYQQRLADMQDRLTTAVITPAGQSCHMCVKHLARLSEISDWMIAAGSSQQESTNQRETGDEDDSLVSSESTAQRPVVVLTEHEQRAMSGLVLEIEEVCSTMSTSTQVEALALLGRAIFGKVEFNGIQAKNSRMNQVSGLLHPTNFSNPGANSISQSRSDYQSVVRKPSITNRGSISPARIRSAPTYRTVLEMEKQSKANIQFDQVRSEEVNEISPDSGSNHEIIATAYPDTRPGIGGLLAVRGRAVSTVVNSHFPSQDSIQPRMSGSAFAGNHPEFQPSYGRKKTVKKLLSHQEFELWRGGRRVYNAEIADIAPDENLASNPASGLESNSQDPGTENSSSDRIPYSIQSTNKGELVYVVDIEVSEDEDEVECEIDSSTCAAVVSIPLPRVISVGDQLVSPSLSFDSALQQFDPSECHQYQQSTRNFSSSSNQSTMGEESVAISSSSDDDPPLIQQLRELLRTNNAAREQLVLSNWRLIVCTALLASRQHRLSTFGIEARIRDGRIETNGGGGSRQLTRIRSLMETIVRRREQMAQAAKTDQIEAKRECRRLQSHIMHNIASMMASLGRRRKVVGATRADPVRTQGYPTVPVISYGSRASFRPLYPAAQVNLGYLPSTQQLSTPSFPTTSDVSFYTSPRLKPSSKNDLDLMNVISAPLREANERQPITSLSHQDGYLHGAFPHRELNFTGPVSPFDYSLMHSASPLTKNQTHSSEVLQRSPSRHAPSITNMEQSKGTLTWISARPESARTPYSQPSHHNPTRPQSSPSLSHRTSSPRVRDIAGGRC